MIAGQPADALNCAEAEPVGIPLPLEPDAGGHDQQGQQQLGREGWLCLPRRVDISWRRPR